MRKKSARSGIVSRSIVICLLFLSVSSCDRFWNDALESTPGGGVILTFDDYYTQDWYNVDHVLSQYNWKATFFVSNLDLLNKEDIERLKTLQSEGHEIGSHSYSHLNAKKFVSSHTPAEYIDTDILPSINALKNDGFVVSSFAYPFGDRTEELDKALLKYFKMIRGTTYGKKPPSEQNNFANGSRVVYGLGIDKSYGNDIDYILELLQYAKEHNKIAVFYGHHVTQEDDPPEYTSNYKTLEAICKFIVKNNMRFMTMKELALDNP